MRPTIHKDFPMKFVMELVAVLAWMIFLFTQGVGQTIKESTTTTIQETTGQKIWPMKIHGTVVSVDVIGKIMIVKTEKAEDTLYIGSGAKIMLGMMELSKEIPLGDLQTGAKVSVTWDIIDGKKSAIKIVEKSVADLKWEKDID
jgi:hypothetical protein